MGNLCCQHEFTPIDSPSNNNKNPNVCLKEFTICNCKECKLVNHIPRTEGSIYYS